MKKLFVPILLLFASTCFSAQLVCIDTGTYHPEFNNIGDIVAIHEDKDRLTGPGYVHFKIHQVKATVAEVRAKLAVKTPDISLLSEEEIKERLSTPKYQFKVIDDKESDIKDMCDTNVVLAPAAEITK